MSLKEFLVDSMVFSFIQSHFTSLESVIEGRAGGLNSGAKWPLVKALYLGGPCYVAVNVINT